jgi:pimeloyl-ACP methyl ester carboxylesterase
MARATILGTGIEYELHGKDGDPAVALTPGGRFTMDVPGLREFAGELVKGGRQVLIYDRPNCGYSDVCLEGESESENQAERLAGLIRHLGRRAGFDARRITQSRYLFAPCHVVD